MGGAKPGPESDVENSKISDQQIEYAGPTHRAVDACASDLSGDIQGAAIFDGDVIVGFLVLKSKAAAPSWAFPGAAVISALPYLPEWLLANVAILADMMDASPLAGAMSAVARTASSSVVTTARRCA